MGGGSAARDAAHSTSSAYSDGGSLQKKSMGKSKKCALTVKQVSVTTWSLIIPAKNPNSRVKNKGVDMDVGHFLGTLGTLFGHSWSIWDAFG